ncbi:MAG: peptidoglycan recognition protein family protein [Bacteroidetes bacterium]|nr:peptidoglycan recognition protein family protein [Bacteroidota bacterium]MBU1485635.1 peptidoglycan recognition protein family protein [Bacteroidota bacterium]MBU1761936.1 peptidoglycan recognition protein family protein [Bacteroidota bacterium]MBU2268302.1 peptidoglycan recognition protein family protein [Bacteroidota bacterium]MBU2376958.1 peptidoglycan recognition protein family protein [Bacteroidota bacterium]
MKFFFTNLLISFFCLNAIGQNKNELKIIEKPIVYNKERVKLSIEYLKIRYGIIQDKPTIIPKIIVLHYTEGGNILSNFNYFNHVKIENERKIGKNQSKLNVSAHYLIDRDGKIYHLVPDTVFARHTIGLNYCAIGIENIGSNKEPLTNQQIQSNAKLIRKLCSKFRIEYLIGHSEYVNFRYTPLWKETNSKYFIHKEDPGTHFLIEVRKLIVDLKLKSKP